MTSLTIDDDIRILDLEDEPAPEPVVNPRPGLRPTAILRAAAGAFALSTGSRDAALFAELPAGAYTLPVTATDNGTGVVLLEVYDPALTSTASLLNASTRAYAGTGSSVLIVGFVVNGTGSLRCLIRAVGPTLAGLGVNGALADPSLGLYLGPALLTANDNWSSAANAGEIAAAASAAGAFTLPANSKDAALVANLPAGAYTAIVTGAANSSGTVLVEIYVLPP